MLNTILLLAIAVAAYFFVKRATRSTMTALLSGVAAIIVFPLLWEQLTPDKNT